MVPPSYSVEHIRNREILVVFILPILPFVAHIQTKKTARFMKPTNWDEYLYFDTFGRISKHQYLMKDLWMVITEYYSLRAWLTIEFWFYDSSDFQQYRKNRVNDNLKFIAAVLFWKYFVWVLLVLDTYRYISLNFFRVVADVTYLRCSSNITK